MIKRLILTLFLAILTGVMLFQAGALDTLFKPPTAFAVGVLTVDWGVAPNTPIFSFNNLAPGNTETHTVSITNGGNLSQAIAIKALKTLDAGSISNVMTILISKNNTPIYGGGNSKTLNQFFTDSNSPDGISLGILQPNEQANYTLTVTFSNTAGNQFQNKKVEFDLQIGITTAIPAECNNINFSNIIVNDKGGKNINGTPGNDLILARGGGDIIKGLGGDDCIMVAGGNIIDAGDGNDVIIASGRGNIIKGGAGNDFIKVGDKSNLVDGGLGTNICLGGIQRNCN